jgi:hypothetical protein
MKRDRKGEVQTVNDECAVHEWHAPQDRIIPGRLDNRL